MDFRPVVLGVENAATRGANLSSYFWRGEVCNSADAKIGGAE